MKSSEPNKWVDKAFFDVLAKAGERLLELWQQERSLLRIEEKGDGSLVSKADYESNKIILEWLGTRYPEDSIFSEESNPDFNAIRATCRTWIIDPLDGTSSFLNGKDDFSVLIGLCEWLKPVFGSMLFPARNKLLVGGKNLQATCNGMSIAVSRSTQFRPKGLYIRNWDVDDQSLVAPAVDSGAALCAVAEGTLDGAIIKMVSHRDWDVAAPSAIIEAAGGRITTESGEEVPFGHKTPPYQYFVASNGILHEQLLELLRQNS